MRRLSLRVEDALYERLEVAAARDRRSLNLEAAHLLEQALDQAQGSQDGSGERAQQR